MSVAGTCEICLAAGVSDTCMRCGQLVCAEHFDEETGLCVECLADAGGGGGGEIPTDTEKEPFRF